MRISNGGPAASLDAIVLFPFDDHSIPFQSGVELHLQGKQTGHGSKPAVPLGEPGAHDSEWIAYYGTVLRVDGELWMWYLGQGPDEHWHQRVCLARSKDGRTWEKPDLGLIEYHRSTHNNLVDMGEDMHVQACVVFHEPDDPVPDKRFNHSSQVSMPYCHHHSSGWGAPASVPSPNYIDIILASDVEPDAYLSACFDCGTSSTFCAPCRPQPPRVLSRQFGDGTLGMF